MMTPEERKAAWQTIVDDDGCSCEPEWVDDTFPKCAFCNAANTLYADHEALAAEVTRLQAEVERLSAPVTDEQVREALGLLSEAAGYAVTFGRMRCWTDGEIRDLLATLTRKLDQQARIIEAARTCRIIERESWDGFESCVEDCDDDGKPRCPHLKHECCDCRGCFGDVGDTEPEPVAECTGGGTWKCSLRGDAS